MQLLKYFYFPPFPFIHFCTNIKQYLVHDHTLSMSVIQKKWSLGAGTKLFWERKCLDLFLLSALKKSDIPPSLTSLSLPGCSEQSFKTKS